jgi:hypothetical protein
LRWLYAYNSVPRIPSKEISRYTVFGCFYCSSPRELTYVFIKHNGMGLFGVKKKIYIALGAGGRKMSGLFNRI